VTRSLEADAPSPLLTWITDHGSAAPDRSGRLRRVDIRSLADAPLPPSDVLIVDVDLRDPFMITAVRRLMKKVPGTTRKIMAVERSSRASMVQAYGLGASDLIGRPITREELRACLARPAAPPGSGARAEAVATPPLPQATHAAAEALGDMFAAFGTETGLNVPALAASSRLVVDAVTQGGHAEWISAVRRYHHGTYQHCLIVTGTVALFACHTGMRRQDVDTLTLAALLHDIGKAEVPLAILDKPGKLDEAEVAAIRRHPAAGYAYLATQPGLTPAILDCVLHHHELLDGSGYPDGLSGGEIRDLTRIVTICDVYSALIERRSYKAPMVPRAAFDVLVEMADAGKLERPLVRALGSALNL
jgi:putative nucleotidyltransferase with HDIG domain